MRPDPKKHEMQQKVFRFCPRRDSIETNKISKGLQVVSGLDQVPPDATQRVTHVQWKREKTAHIGRVNVEQVICQIYAMTIGSGGSRSTAMRPNG